VGGVHSGDSIIKRLSSKSWKAKEGGGGNCLKKQFNTIQGSFGWGFLGEGVVFADGHFGTDLFEGLADFVVKLAFGADEVLGLDEAGEAGGGEGEDAQEGEGFKKVGGDGARFDGTADDEAEEVDLFLEADAFKLAEAFEVGALEAAGIEAVFEGVEVAGRGAAAAFGGSGHGREVFHRMDRVNRMGMFFCFTG
jgi:hypothetical protein